jgi:hypothetical protein
MTNKLVTFDEGLRPLAEALKRADGAEISAQDLTDAGLKGVIPSTPPKIREHWQYEPQVAGPREYAPTAAELQAAGLKGVIPSTAPKDPNPKDSIGSTKIPIHLWPTTATIMGALGLQDGALKYGRSNFRAAPVRASIYYDAAMRHLMAWFEGRQRDPDSGLPDLAHALACLAILVDAECAGTLIDDRMVDGGYLSLLAEMTPQVRRLQELHKDKNPKHYTIADSLEKPL